MLCPDCMKKLQVHPELCPYCHGYSSDYKICIKCKTQESSLQGIITVFNYTGLLKKLILALKYYHKYSVCNYLADKLATAIQCNQAIHHFLKDPNSVLITHVPSHWFRKHMIKGYNQSELLAQQLAELLHIQHKHLLTKTKHTSSQTALDRQKRLLNLKSVFMLKPTISLQDIKLVIIVDDITTTGSTLQEAAKSIKQTYPHLTIWWAVLARSNW